MEYFRSSLKNVLTGPENAVQMSGADTIERLVERVLHSTLLDDRRDACRAIRALSRKYRVHVGARGLNALIGILKTDRADCEIIGYALDTLCNVVSPTVFEEEESPIQNDSPALAHESLLHVGEQFTEMFIKDPSNVTLVLDFLEEYDFKVRWPALKFLSSLLTNRCRDIQEIILVSPMGVSKLMDLLSDSREVIRNDALLLLIQLTKSNTNIQKIVAFENAFDRLFDVIAEEGYAEGGIVVEDCLLLMLNLLRNNTSNQNFFKEGSYIRRLCGIFDLRVSQPEENQWAPQKVSNTHCVLQVIRALVSPSNPGQVTSSCQKSLQSSGVVEALSHLMMSSGVPVDLLTEVICTLGESMRGDLANQEYFSSLSAPSNPAREATVLLLMTMINEKQPFILRAAVLYCMQCYLYKNEDGQAKLIHTLLPSSNQVDLRMTGGKVLCSGMLASDPISNWLSSVALSHAVIENPVQKEQLLRVLLAPNQESSPVTLLQQTFLLLQQSCKVQSKVGFLILLSTWLSHCEPAVQMFLAIPSASSYLMSQVASNERDENEELVQGMFAFLLGVCILFNENSEKSNLIQLVGKRIGLESFLSKLSEVSKHEQYSKAAKHTQPCATTANELLLDNEFCKLFRVLEGMIIKTMQTESGKDQVVTPSDSEMLLYYKDVIRNQDKKNEELASENKRLHSERNDLQQKLDELTNSYRQLMDENLILKAQIGTNLRSSRDQHSAESGSVAGELAQYSNDTINDLSHELSMTNLQEHDLKYQNQPDQFVSMEMDRLRKDQEDLLFILAEKQEKLNTFKKRLKELGEQVEDDDDGDEDDLNSI